MAPLEGLRIIVFMVLVFAVHIHLSHYTMGMPSPEGQHANRMEAHVKQIQSKPREVNRKVALPHPETHSKGTGSCPEQYVKLLNVDGNSKQQRQTGAASGYVKDCPSQCYCKLVRGGSETALLVTNCKSDPIAVLPKLFDSHRDTTQLTLDQCHLTRLPLEIRTLPLDYVKLTMNEFSMFPQELLQLPRLMGLVMYFSNLSCLPADVTKLSSLMWLDLSYNAIAELPQEIGAMQSLCFLKIIYNQLESLPQSIGSLSHLGQLELSHNELKSLPTEVGNLTELLGLYLANNKLRTVPSEIGKLSKLVLLELQNNEITALPNEITKLRHLRILRISDNPLMEMPALPKESLVAVFCNNCSLQRLPCELFNQGLDSLGLSRNAIRSFGCEQNFYLVQLDLSHNLLQEIPCEFHISSRLKFLDVSYNNISTLPAGPCISFNLYVLEAIRLNNNRINVLHFSSLCTETSQQHLGFIGFAQNRLSAIDTKGATFQHCFRVGARIELQNNRLSSLDSWPMLLSQIRSITINVNGNYLSQFTSSVGSFLHGSQFGSVFRMQGNQIKHFMDVFNGWKVIVNTTEKLHTVLRNAYFDLGFNPLVCDCVDYEVYKYIQTLTTEQYDNIMCHEPLFLREQNPRYIHLRDFVCDVDVKCPIGCNCANVPYSHSINITCLTYNLTDIPEDVPDLPKQNYGYQIDLCHQNLHEITFRQYLPRVTEIILSNNSIVAIKINTSFAFQMIRVLHLDNNLLQRLPESVAGITNDSAIDVRLGGNPWVCDCETMAMKNWIMMNWHVVKDKDNTRCHSPPNMVGVKVHNIERSVVCPHESTAAMYVIAAISGLILVFLVYLAIADKLKYANWRLVGSDECDGEGKEFDVFMCAAVADAEYVEEYLIPELEKRDFRVLYHLEHFHGGKPIHVNMSEAFEKSKRTLAFFSNNFLVSAYSMFEFHSAYDLDIRNKTRRLVTIKDTDLDMRKLDISEALYFEAHTYIARESDRFWKLLENTLPRKRLGAQVRNEGL